ncbi:MAG: hypothetical protein PWR29_1995 [Methanolobus sp.]|nr:hypothetical protein [Methanolobus sp.]
MNPRLKISSGPFNVPLVEHVIVVQGRTTTKASWTWEILRAELYAAFPHLENTKASPYDEKLACGRRMPWCPSSATRIS